MAYLRIRQGDDGNYFVQDMDSGWRTTDSHASREYAWQSAAVELATILSTTKDRLRCCERSLSRLEAVDGHESPYRCIYKESTCNSTT